jgi:hypothetical protein
MAQPSDTALAARADGWLALGLTVAPADRADAEAGVRQAYELAGLTPPERIEWRGSPAAGARLARALAGSGEAGATVRGPVRTRPWAQARADLVARLGPAGWAEYWAAAGARTWPLLNDRLVMPLRARIVADLSAEASGAPEASAAPEASGVDSAGQAAVRIGLLDAVYGQHDGAWLAAFDDQPALAGIARVARSAGWWWPYERVAILTERPTALHRDNIGRLHHGDGPALSYPDGWALYAWRGMPIPPSVADELPSLTVQRIQDEPNAEVRRVMLEFFGFDRYLRECQAKEVSRDEYGVLWRVNLPDDEPLVMVEVVNSTPEPDGTSRTYFLRVPPRTRTPREGVAWTFGLTEEEYAPHVQT